MHLPYWFLLLNFLRKYYASEQISEHSVENGHQSWPLLLATTVAGKCSEYQDEWLCDIWTLGEDGELLVLSYNHMNILFQKVQPLEWLGVYCITSKERVAGLHPDEDILARSKDTDAVDCSIEVQICSLFKIRRKRPALLHCENVVLEVFSTPVSW